MTLAGRRGYAVIGAGVAGLSLARRLATAGAEVVLLEAASAGAGASGASAGVIKSPKGAKSLLSRLAIGAHAGYDRFAADLEAETGISLGFSRRGYLDLALDGEEEAQLRKAVGAHRSSGAPAEWIDGAMARSMVPGIAAGVLGALWLPGAATIDPPSLVAALRASVLRLGVRLMEGVRAGIVRGRDGWTVTAGEGEPIEGRQVIVAAGAWTPTILEAAGLAPPAPIVPIRGQMAEVEWGAPGGPVIHQGEIYIIPRPGGTAWVGATVEEAGFDASVTEGGIAGLLEAGRRAFPGLGRTVRAWAGLRPKLMRRGGPLIGEGDPPVLAGHYRSGIQLGPITAHILAARLMGDPGLAGPFPVVEA